MRPGVRVAGATHMDRETWCAQFVATWAAAEPEMDADLVQRIALRSYEDEGDALAPELSSREHRALLQRIKIATTRRGGS